MSNDKIFNFPIQLLQGAHDMKAVCNNIMDYALFVHSRNLNGSITERMKSAATFFGIKLGDLKSSVDNGQLLFDSIPVKSPMTGITKNVLFEFYKGCPTIEEITFLMGHLALKSILGKKTYSRVTKEFLLCRMAGFVSQKEMIELPEYLKKYAFRWHFDKLKFELTERYGWQTYGRYTRGFFVSQELPLKELIRNVEIKRQKYRLAEQKRKQTEALSEVLRELGKLPTS